MEKEIWKVVPCFEDYIVSNMGKVVSLKIRKGNFKYLKHDHTRSYPCVTLCNNGKQRRVFVHILVAENFLERVENKPCINHKNGIKSDPRLSNLEWCTQSENQLHATRTGLQGIGEFAIGAKRTDRQINQVCQLISKGLKRQEILNICPFMSKGVFDSIRGRRRWKHISQFYKW